VPVSSFSKRECFLFLGGLKHRLTCTESAKDP
jgi:hypothetical protein